MSSKEKKNEGSHFHHYPTYTGLRRKILRFLCESCGETSNCKDKNNTSFCHSKILSIRVNNFFEQVETLEDSYEFCYSLHNFCTLFYFKICTRCVLFSKAKVPCGMYLVKTNWMVWLKKLTFWWDLTLLNRVMICFYIAVTWMYYKHLN